jgi:two-component system cell cycle sensor histidine kinase/response regulator CckA
MVSGRKAFEPVICPLADVFRGSEALVRRALGARNTLHFPSAIECVVRIDAHQIEQVFINLAVNAKDAMPDGGRLTFDVAAVSRASAESAALFALADPALWAIDYVAILVADSGSGIPPEVVSEIFEPFVSTKGPTSGTGLGLAVSRGIARAHGGDLILLSTSPKVGTTFCLLLPREVRAAGPENVKATGTSIERPGGGRQILLVDDNDALRVRLGASLRRRGWNVVLAASAAEARESWSLEPAAFVAVVTDILMPEETGDVLVARLRDLQPNLPVVYITGFVDGAPTTDDRTALLEKPFSIDALARAIEDVTE